MSISYRYAGVGHDYASTAVWPDSVDADRAQLQTDGRTRGAEAAADRPPGSRQALAGRTHRCTQMREREWANIPNSMHGRKAVPT